jgi:hypothetical protein
MAPIGTPPETKSPSMYQRVEAYLKWGPASVLIHSKRETPHIGGSDRRRSGLRLGLETVSQINA